MFEGFLIRIRLIVNPPVLLAVCNLEFNILITQFDYPLNRSCAVQDSVRRQIKQIKASLHINSYSSLLASASFVFRKVFERTIHFKFVFDQA